MGQRGNFEEDYSGDSLQGSYIAGIYYPDKTKVGWWKNGYPEYFAKVINSVNWTGIHLKIEGQLVDLAKVEILAFERVLDMKEGRLDRRTTIRTNKGHEISIEASRFYSMRRDEICSLKYSVKSINFNGQMEINPYLDFDVRNEDANYDEKFWLTTESFENNGFHYVEARTRKLNFSVGAGMLVKVSHNAHNIRGGESAVADHKTGSKFAINVKPNDEVTLEKFVSIVSNFYYNDNELKEKAKNNTEEALNLGFEALKAEQTESWADIWSHSDITIEGDTRAQQGIRFNIFHLKQTYTGEDERLNIGPKGFTGEKYGGSTYWDTEAYCLPFYLSTAENKVSKNLLMYRYRHLQKAIENAEKLGFSNGAALYPMVTMNGEECHNEWEITFEEIHRNGAIAYAIYYYTRYTGDSSYLYQYGLEVLIAISRFWSQRVNFSEQRQKYVMLGVTGPNEYENNVDNNWYTLYIARWCMIYTTKHLKILFREKPEQYKNLVGKTMLHQSEIEKWQDISENLHFPFDEKRNVFLQQENFLDKELRPASSIPSEEVPIWQNWSWDRILRSCFIKQADVLQGLYFFEDDFDKETIQRNYDFYEPMTVHESSLSPCVHSILAAKLGRVGQAYQFYLRTARLDLDNYNNDTDDGLHITSMAGTWMSVVKGFGGLRVRNDKLHLSPVLPKEWKSLGFRILYRGIDLHVKIDGHQINIHCKGEQPLEVMVHGELRTIKPGENKISLTDDIQIN
jgi:maltose phosphorylase